MNVEVCPGCEEPTVVTKRWVTPTDLRGPMARLVVGVQLNDGKRVFFEEPFEMYARPKGQSSATSSTPTAEALGKV